jgi:hypothetical protein
MSTIIPNSKPNARVVITGDNGPVLVPIIAWQVPEQGPLVAVTALGLSYGEVRFIDHA